MKNIRQKIILSITGIYLSITSSYLAFANPTTEGLLPKPQTGISIETKTANALPDLSAEHLISSIIKETLKWTFSISVIALIIAGFYYLISQGEDDDINKAKEIIKYLIIGLLIISAAYGIISGIAEFNFFKSKI